MIKPRTYPVNVTHFSIQSFSIPFSGHQLIFIKDVNNRNHERQHADVLTVALSASLSVACFKDQFRHEAVAVAGV